MSPAPPRGDSLEWLSLAHREEMNDLRFRIMRYRALLEQSGIVPPDDAGADGLASWRDCAAVVNAAYALVQAAEEFRRKLGTSEELIRDWRR